ncbi:molybdopterin-dependent oxidoreductase [Bdellovibrionota bacterium FG-1]
MKKRGLALLLIGALSAWAQAGEYALASNGSSVPQPSVVPEPVIVVGIKSGKIFVEHLDVANLSKKWVALKSTPPHRQLNPEHQVFQYEGIELKHLLRAHNLPRAGWVCAIGVDDYVSMIPAELIRNHRALLAFHENGKPLIKQRGGQQVVYPTEPGDHPIAEIYAKKAAFWAWYVKALVVGRLPNSILWDKDQAVISGLAAQSPPIRMTPLPTFSYEKYECPKVYSISVNRFLVSRGHKMTAPVRFLSLSGRAVNVSSEDIKEGRYLLLAARGDAGFPVQCGGPFLLVRRESVAVKASDGANPEVHDYVPLIYKIEGIEGTEK